MIAINAKSEKQALAWLKKKRIAVLMGGQSEEREISQRTGKAVLKALRDLSLNALSIDADERLAEKIRARKIGFCFIALHGKFGEDGTVQGLCEILRVPYSGSGVLASALSMNKVASKIIFRQYGIPTPLFEIGDPAAASFGTLFADCEKKLRYPLVVKPLDGGSAIGVHIVKERKAFARAVKDALRYSQKVLVEKFVRGKEVTVPVLGRDALPAIEIVPKSSFYDFRAKYVKGMSDHILPARVSRSMEYKIRKYALAAHDALGCSVFSRTDFMIDAQGRPWALELNSIPGMTETSLFPESARAAGLSFPRMIVEIVRLSLVARGITQAA